MRTNALSASIIAIVAIGWVACSDDDGTDVNNNNDSQVTCGDGVANGTETCDDADLRGNDCTSIGEDFTGGALGCNATCSGWDTSGCTGGGDCGNGAVDPGEACDDVNLLGYDCTTVPGGSFSGGTLACLADCSDFDTSGCTTAPECGDGVIETPEVCDGAALDGYDCETLPGETFTGGVLDCLLDCSDFDTSGCTGGCGDGVIDTGEVCDGAALGGADCTTISGGFDGGVLACLPDCSDYDTSSCTSPGTCGDGAVNTGELCDGAALGGNDCTTIGLAYTGGTLGCNGTCDGWDVSQCTGGAGGPVCGDNVVEGLEQCDGTAPIDPQLECTAIGFTGGTTVCDANCELDFSGCTSGIAGWTCNPAWYSDADCDCGCGIPDPACGGDTTTTPCQYCGEPGSCSFGLDCPGIIDPTDNTTCTASVCGDGAAAGLEQCDGSDWQGFTDCASLGLAYNAGALSCDANCNFNLSGCYTACLATSLGLWAGVTIVQTGDTCSGSSTYNPGQACTGYAAQGMEDVYSLTLPAGASVTITYDAGSDNSLYVITDCLDVGATTCVAGSDSNWTAPFTESVSVTNSTGADVTYYIVADNYESTAPDNCSSYTLTIQ